MARWIRWLTACGLCAFAAGCGGEPLLLDGKAVKGAAPYALGDKEAISVSLVGEDGQSAASGDVGPDGRFQVKGSAGAGVMPGRYKVSTTHYNAPGAKPNAPPVTRKNVDVWEVSPASKSFTLDLGKK